MLTRLPASWNSGHQRGFSLWAQPDVTTDSISALVLLYMNVCFGSISDLSGAIHKAVVPSVLRKRTPETATIDHPRAGLIFRLVRERRAFTSLGDIFHKSAKAILRTAHMACRRRKNGLITGSSTNQAVGSSTILMGSKSGVTKPDRRALATEGERQSPT